MKSGYVTTHHKWWPTRIKELYEMRKTIVICLFPASMLCVLFMNIGCYKTPYFAITQEHSFVDGSISFRMFSLDFKMKSANDTAKINDTVYGAFARASFEKYGHLEYDTSRTYWSLGIIYSPVSSMKSDRHRMLTDSIYLNFHEPIGQVRFIGLAPTNSKFIGRYTIYIEPIGIPKSYREDFEVVLNLTIYDRDGETILRKLPLTVTCVYKIRTWTPLYPGR